MKKTTLVALLLSTFWGHSQVKNYKFSQITGTYSEISAGTVLGDESSDSQRFVDTAAPLGSTTVFTGIGLPIGFNFTFNGYVYDRFAVSTDGWISLGASNQVDCTVTNSAAPLSSIAAVATNMSAKISALGMDLMAQTGSSISYKTIGTSPNQILVVQWKGFKKGGSIGTGDNFNFQIRLNETANTVSIAYGTFMSNSTYINNSVTPIPTAQVGLRAAPADVASNFVNRTATAGWGTSAAGVISTDNLALNGPIVPSSGLTFTWTAPTCGGNKATAIYEDFDNYSGSFTLKGLPDCWSKTLTGTGDAYITNSGPPAPYSAPNRLYLVGNSGTIMPGVAYVILPTLSNLMVGTTATNRLRFKAYASVANGTLDIGYLTDSNNAASTFVLIQTVTLSTAATSTQIVISPTNIPATATNLVFRNKGFAGSQLSVNIDDLVWEPISACSDVSALAGSGFTTNSMNLSWTKGASEVAWQYAYGLASALNPNEQTVVNVTSPTITGSNIATTVSGLSPATSYKIWVRSKCTDGSFGAWVGPFVFSTTPVPVSQVMENFDAGLTLPIGWSKVPGTTGTVLVNTAPIGFAPSSPNYLQLFGASTAAYSMVALPPVSNLAVGTNLLKFRIRASVAGVNMDIGYLDDIADASTFHLIKQITIDQVTSFESRVEAFGQILGATPYLVFRNPGLPIGTLYIDNVSWETNTISSCPVVTSFATTSVSSTAVGLSWNAGGSESAWQYAIGDATLPNPFSLTPVDATSFAAPLATTISNLAPATSYRVWLRSKCGSSFGAWIGPLTFTTTCSSGTGFSQNFDASTDTPGCWYKASGYVTIGSLTSTPSMPNVLTLNSFPASASFPNVPAIMAMPPVANLGSGNYRVKFSYKASAANAVLELGYMTNVSDPTSFNQIQALTITSTSAFTSATIELGQFSGSEILAFRNAGTLASYIYIDDVVVEQIPSCLDISNLVAIGVTNNTVSLDWDNVSGQNKWQYAVGPSSVDSPTGLSAVDVAAASEVTINDLSPDTNYKVWVRSKCSTFGLGSWIGPVTFKTTCTPSGGISESFDSSKNLPACWTRVGNGGKLYLSYLISPAVSTGNVIGLGPTPLPGGTYTNANPLVIAMPPISNAGTGDLNFKYTATIAGSVIEVGYLTNILDPTSFVSFKTITVDVLNVFQKAVVQLSAPILSNTIAFRNGSENLSYIYIDDVSIYENPALGLDSFDTANFVYYPNPVKDVLNISLDQEISEVAVINLLGQKVITKSVNANQTKVDMSELSKGTYLVKITAENQTKTIKAIKE